MARKDNSGAKTYYHADHLGSTTLVTNQSGGIVEEEFYLPFGDTLEGSEDSRFLYTGKEKDSGTGLYYYGARYYSSFARQFIQADSVIADVYDPQNLNRYSYVLNNPYKYVDPNGLWAVLIGPSLTGVLGIGPVGIAARMGEGIGISYSKAQGFQFGGFNVNAIGVGLGPKLVLLSYLFIQRLKRSRI